MAKVTKGKKQWYQIVAPAMFRNRTIGEILLLEPSPFIGKTFAVNLMNITNDIRKQNTNVFFEASGFKEGKINTKVCGYEIMPSSIKRLVRRGRNRINISFVCRTSDGVHIRVKPIAITYSKISSSVMRSLSKKIVEELTKKVRKASFETLISNLINQRLQLDWRDEFKKVHPLKFFEIRSIKIERTKRGLKEVPVVPEEKEEPGKKMEEKEVKKEVKVEAKKPEENKEAPKAEEKAEKPKVEAKVEKEEVKAAVEG
ncbi:hypothetical protein KY360_04525 [Candidatus Woesearchaeota archaeon]|nr:hypothetical protein [Candidatus Woesearchaeota archaeon]